MLYETARPQDDRQTYDNHKHRSSQMDK